MVLGEFPCKVMIDWDNTWSLRRDAACSADARPVASARDHRSAVWTCAWVQLLRFGGKVLA